MNDFKHRSVYVAPDMGGGIYVVFRKDERHKKSCTPKDKSRIRLNNVLDGYTPACVYLSKDGPVLTYDVPKQAKPKGQLSLTLFFKDRQNRLDLAKAA